MRKFVKTLSLFLLLLTVALALIGLVACDTSSTFDNKIEIYDFTRTVQLSLSVRTRRLSHWPDNMGFGMSYTFKYRSNDVSKLYNEIKTNDGVNVSLSDNGYILIDKEHDGVVFSWLIIPKSVDDGRYNFYVSCMNLSDDVNTDNFYPNSADNTVNAFFPVYTLSDGTNGKYKCSMSIDELTEYYSAHGYDVSRDGDILTVHTSALDSFPENTIYDYYNRCNVWKVEYVDEHSVKFDWLSAVDSEYEGARISLPMPSGYNVGMIKRQADGSIMFNTGVDIGTLETYLSKNGFTITMENGDRVITVEGSSLKWKLTVDIEKFRSDKPDYPYTLSPVKL